MAAESVLNLDEVTIRLAGDSGDGMQLVGTELTNASALLGNDVGTLPDYPAEIRAPAGTLPGVSGFQLHIGSFDIQNGAGGGPGEAPFSRFPRSGKHCGRDHWGGDRPPGGETNHKNFQSNPDL